MLRMSGFIVLCLTLITLATSAQTIIPAGSVSGTWTLAGSPYLVEGEIAVEENTSLAIDPGVVVDFQGYYKLVVNGWLVAEGTAEDSIHFTAANPSEGWHGIRFTNAPDSSRLIFCTIQYGCSADSDSVNWGGGIHCVNSNPVIRHCLISGNSAVIGGGICCLNSNPTIENCTIRENWATGVGSVGGGIYCWGSNPNIQQCVITGNFGGAIYTYESPAPNIDQCTITWNTGGVYFNDSDASISNCTIHGNDSGDTGGGITCAWGADAIISNCLITENLSDVVGGGIGCWDSDPIIENCVISGNVTGETGGGGIYFSTDSCPIVVNVIVEGNTGNGATYFHNSPIATITHCDFYNNGGSSFAGNSIPADLGELSAINANGDSCDTFFNIFEDPLFGSEPLSDYHLSPNSPCIDAGNPVSQYNDPEDPVNPGTALWPAQGTIVSDMGIYGGPGAGDWFVGIKKKNPNSSGVPSIFNLQQNYPNPFNPYTTIRFGLPAAAQVNLTVYNILGQQITVLVDGYQQAGYYEVIWNASQLASGVYLYRIKAAEFIAVKRMVLVK
ncbi:right-handed parallel beta-helix repeat-containing protein [bacterium]|nr:right-handed parallel beta-helix repeat-containing protein [bacterium]